MKNAIYAGSFDPITRGHLDIVEQALAIFDHLTIAIGQHPTKQRTFAIEESIAIIQAALGEVGIDQCRIDVTSFDGALVDFVAEQSEPSAVVRGLRQVSDFNDEFIQHGVNTRLSAAPFVYLICKTDFLHVSSSTVREMARYKLYSDMAHYVTPTVETALKMKYGPHGS